MLQSFFRSLRAYPWGQQALCLLPSVLLLFGLTVCIGSGDAVSTANPSRQRALSRR